MMRTVLLLVFLPIFAMAQQSTESADKSMILALESAWNQAEIHHDANAAAALMADTFISVDHHGALLNKGQYLAGIKDMSFSPQGCETAKLTAEAAKRRKNAAHSVSCG